MKDKNAKTDFKWNVWTWSFNHDKLEQYDVVPIFMGEYNRLGKNAKPKTKKEFSEFLENEARYHFRSKCEWEMIVHGWPVQKSDEKVDVYGQLKLNWDAFVDGFWNGLCVELKSSHRKQRGRTAPNRALGEVSRD